jgi:hypothetical protein
MTDEEFERIASIRRKLKCFDMEADSVKDYMKTLREDRRAPEHLIDKFIADVVALREAEYAALKAEFDAA